MKALSDHIGVLVDKKTGVTTISITMQDPRISTCLTDTVVNRLQSYIIDYRTNKARKEFHFQEKLFERKKKGYKQAQENYAKFADANKNIIFRVTVPNKCVWKMRRILPIKSIHPLHSSCR